MPKIKIFIILFALTGLAAACKKGDPIIDKWLNNTTELRKHNEGKITISEGIAGTLTLIEGDCMPAGGGLENTCKEYPVKRKIMIYEYTLISQAEKDKGSFYTKVNTKLMATAECDKEGFYQVKIAPGKYSLFIEEKGKLYASGLDGYGWLNPVTVEAGKVANGNLRLSYAVW